MQSKNTLLQAQRYAKIFAMFNLIIGILSGIVLIILRRYTEIGLAVLLFANAGAFNSISNLIK